MLQNFFTVLIIAFKVQYSIETSYYVSLVLCAYESQVRKSLKGVLFIEYFFSKHDVTDGTWVVMPRGFYVESLLLM